MGPAPAVAAVRSAVRSAVADIGPGGLLLVACSGGADSLALAAAAAFEAPRRRLRAGAVTVDHRLQPGSAERAGQLAHTLADLGLAPVEVASVEVASAGAGGPEAAARAARYGALEEAAGRLGAAAVLLGHTRDDQAESVLLGLARGSGARSLSGMPARRGLLRRPLLGLDRAVTRAACAAAGLRPWEDPHNRADRYARARVRHRVLPVLEAELGPGVAAALARTAELIRDDADALDAWAAQVLREATAAEVVPGAETAAPETGTTGGPPTGGPPTGMRQVRLDVGALAAVPAAVRRRVLHRAARAAGSPGSALAAVHVRSLEALVVGWHGQAWVDLPGGVRARRSRACLVLTPGDGRSAGGTPTRRAGSGAGMGA